MALGFGVCLAMANIIGIVAVMHMAQLNSISKMIASDSLKCAVDAGRVQVAQAVYRLTEYRLLLSKSDSDKSGAYADLIADGPIVEKAIKDYSTVITDPVGQASITNVATEWQQYEAMNDQLIQFSKANNFASGYALATHSMRTSYNKQKAELTTMAENDQKRGDAYSKEAATAYAGATSTIICLNLFATVFGALLGILITRYTVKTVSELAASLRSITDVCLHNLEEAVFALEQGDLTYKIQTGSKPLPVRSRDEFGQMVATFNVMLERTQATITSFTSSQKTLSMLVMQLKNSAGHVDDASKHLAGTSQEIGSATEEINATMQEVTTASEQSARAATEVAGGSSIQAASISEGAEMVKQLAQTVRNVAKDSESTAQSVVEATQSAEIGAKSVRDTVSGMHTVQKTIAESAEAIEQLGESSKQIGTIVQTIEDIADQTNLLALNAAIEAARAGETGRGFAVVADEVRKLAERSRNATKEIAHLIENVQSQTARAVISMEGGVHEVKNNTALAETAGESLNEIQAAVALVTERVENICKAAVGMASSSDQVAQTMVEIASVVEESSAAAEEMSASAEEVSSSVASVAGTTALQTASVANLVVSAGELADVSAELTELISRFEVDAEFMAADRPKLSLSAAASKQTRQTQRRAA